MSSLAESDCPSNMQHVYRTLVSVLVASSLTDAGWYSAAEAALAALFELHAAPHTVAAAVAQHLASVALQGVATSATADEGQGPSAVSAPHMSRFFFVLGHTALQQMVSIYRQPGTYV